VVNALPILALLAMNVRTYYRDFSVSAWTHLSVTWKHQSARTLHASQVRSILLCYMFFGQCNIPNLDMVHSLLL